MPVLCPNLFRTMRLKLTIVVCVLIVIIILAGRYRSSTLGRPVPLDGEVHLTFQGIEKTEYGSIAFFSLRNGSAEILYYPGYSQDNTCSYKIKRGDTIVPDNPCWCGTGLAERHLGPGDATLYKINVRGETGGLQVGFDFEVGATRKRRTIWSQEFVTF